MTTVTLKIALAQLSFKLGDIAHNCQHIINAITQAHAQQVDVVVFPELALTGYPPEDLLLRTDFVAQAEAALITIAQHTIGITAIIGCPQRTPAGLYNAAAILQDGKITGFYHKQCLPNYGVFDEKRYFLAGTEPFLVKLKGATAAVLICEDLWQPQPIDQAKAAGAQLVFALNASPFDLDKAALRLQTLQQRCQETQLPICYVQSIGGQDEIIFDGGSFVLDQHGQIQAQAPYFTEDCLLATAAYDINGLTIQPTPLPAAISAEARVYRALVLGVQDYVNKNRFPGVLLGLSGGIDSALTLAIAVDALGSQRVQALILPSRYTSEFSIEQAIAQAKMLGVAYQVISIEAMYAAFLQNLTAHFADLSLVGLTAQNLQARCRGTLLMAFSNESNYLVLTTTNKSELATGYGTLYGDLAGGFAVLKDVYKTWVYRLAHYRNQLSAAIPQSVIAREPTAELAPNQRDQDSLPPYPLLDEILLLYLERNASAAEIIAQGFAADIVEQVIKLVQRSEYKRRQAPLGPKITARAFGRDWRYPVTAK